MSERRGNLLIDDRKRKVGGRILDLTFRTNIESGLVPPLMYVSGFLAKRRVYNDSAECVTSEYGVPTITMGHRSGRPPNAKEVAEVADYIAQNYQQPAVLALHSNGGRLGTEAVHDHWAPTLGLMYMQPAGFGGVIPHKAPESLRYEKRPVWDLIKDTYIAIDGLRYAIGAGVSLPLLAYRAARHRVDDKAEVLLYERGVPINGLGFRNDPFIVTKTVARSFNRIGIPLAIAEGSHNAQYSRARETAPYIAGLYGDILVRANLGEAVVRHAQNGFELPPVQWCDVEKVYGYGLNRAASEYRSA